MSDIKKIDVLKNFKIDQGLVNSKDRAISNNGNSNDIFWTEEDNKNYVGDTSKNKEENTSYLGGSKYFNECTGKYEYPKDDK